MLKCEPAVITAGTRHLCDCDWASLSPCNRPFSDLLELSSIGPASSRLGSDSSGGGGSSQSRGLSRAPLSPPPHFNYCCQHDRRTIHTFISSRKPARWEN